MILDDYLDYLYESKWKKLLAAGKLKKSDLMKVKKAGIPKSQRQWVAGVEKGSKEIVRKKGGRFSTKMNPGQAKKLGFKKGSKISDLGHAHSTPGTGRKPVVHAGRAKTKNLTAGAIIKRHEAEELSARKRMSKYKGKRKKPVARVTGMYGVAHASPEVLRKERELSRTASALYGKKGKGDVIHKYRKKTREYEDIPEDRKPIRKLERRATKIHKD